MSRAERIRAALAVFAPAMLMVADESAKHVGHAGAAPGGETHYDVRIVSEQFSGLSRVERQRLVYAALEPEFQQGLHALSLKALTLAEASRAGPAG